MCNIYKKVIASLLILVTFLLPNVTAAQTQFQYINTNNFQGQISNSDRSLQQQISINNTTQIQQAIEEKSLQQYQETNTTNTQLQQTSNNDSTNLTQIQGTRLTSVQSQTDEEGSDLQGISTTIVQQQNLETTSGESLQFQTYNLNTLLYQDNQFQEQQTSIDGTQYQLVSSDSTNDVMIDMKQFQGFQVIHFNQQEGGKEAIILVYSEFKVVKEDGKAFAYITQNVIGDKPVKPLEWRFAIGGVEQSVENNEKVQTRQKEFTIKFNWGTVQIVNIFNVTRSSNEIKPEMSSKISATFN